MKNCLLFTAIAFVFFTGKIWSQTTTVPDNEIGAGPFIRIFQPSIKWQLIMQNRFEASLTDSIDVQNKFSADPLMANFRIRRMAIRTDISLTEKLTGVVRVQLPELKISSTPGKAIELAYANYKFSEAFQVRAGQFLVPFALDELTPYDNLRMIDRGPNSVLFVNSSLASYQPGIMLLGNLFTDKKPLNYFLAVVNGSDRSIPNDNNTAKNMIARLEFTPVKGLRIGAGDELIGLKNEMGNAYAADISYTIKLKTNASIMLEGEYITGANVALYSADTAMEKNVNDFTMSGFQGLALLKIDLNKRWCKMIEVGGKFEQTDPLTTLRDNDFITTTGDIAFNFLEDNKARLQFNLVNTRWASPISPGMIDASNIFLAQFQLKI